MKNLREYKRKRDFLKTAEPEPITQKRSKTHNTFVIQKHAASHLHYDFRLEIAGVLKSWAIPKGIPFKQGEKHLAVHVEDHPLAYGQFEGTIPHGAYGGGTVMLWDVGEYAVSGDDPLAAYKSGKLHLELDGKKLQGEWTLVRTRASESDKNAWLLMKTGNSVRPISRRKDDESVKSERTMQEIASAQDSAAESPSSSTRGVTSTTPLLRLAPKFVQPMKAKLVKTLPTGKGWAFEVKFDGYRAIALKDGNKVLLYSRNKKRLNFPEISEALSKLRCTSGTFDGEIVALDKDGRPSFQLLQARESGLSSDAENAPICFYLFDLLLLDGVNLCKRPLFERKKVLDSLIPKSDSTLRLSGNLPGTPEEILSQIKERGLEGIIAKRRDSQYEPGQRTGAWIKFKCINEQEFVIGGYTRPKGSRSHFGALLVGYYDGGNLRFAGKVGTGFTERLLATLAHQFKPLLRPSCPFANLPSTTAGRWNQGITASQMKQCTWMKPEIVCQVKFAEWTRDGRLRQPVFLGIRTDKAANEVVRETT